MIFKSKKLILRLFTIALMAATIGIMYPGYQVSAGTESQCIENCGSMHQSIEQCYQQAICKKNCRLTECQQRYDRDTEGCVPPAGPIPPLCFFIADQNYAECVAPAESGHRSAISFCDRIYWTHCPDPQD